MTSYAIRVDETTKAQAQAVAKSYGLDLASVTRAFWTQMARTGNIPLTFEGQEPNDDSLEAIRETQEIFAAHEKGTGYQTAHELLEAARM